MTAEAFPSYTEIQRAWRDLAASAAGGRPLRVALGGNCNMDFCKTGLMAGLAQRGYAAAVEATAYGNWVGAALSGSVEADVWLVWLSAMAASSAELERPAPDLSGVAAAAQALLSKGAVLVVVMPEMLAAEDDPFSPFAAWRRDFAQAVDGCLPAGAVRLRVEQLQRKLGDRRWFAPRYWTMAKAPCHPDGATAVGLAAATTIAQALRPAIKAVLVDLDNTLWGGVVGDDGVDGIQLDRFGEGRPFLAMQRFVLDLKQMGLPLAVVSKNEPDNARGPFRQRPEMLLTLDDFACFHASWRQKHLAIAEIARELNLGMDALCFLDDSPQERAEARTFLPELVVPELPEDPEQRVAALRATGLFSLPLLGRDDAERAARYDDERRRRDAEAAAPDHDSYLRDLCMVLQPMPIGPANLARAAQLVQKTNQFNLSNRRHTGVELAAMAEAPGAYATCFGLADRFGEAGIISVMAGAVEGDTFVLDTWVLSCRAFGRQVEHAILEHLAQWCRRRGVASIAAGYRPSGKNPLVLQFLTEAGFDIAGEVDGERRCTVRLDGLALTHRLGVAAGASPSPTAAEPT